MSPGLGVVGVVGPGEYNPVAESVSEKGGVEVSVVVVVVVVAEVAMVVVAEVAMVVVVDGCSSWGFRTASLNVNAPEFVPKLWGVVGCLVVGVL